MLTCALAKDPAQRFADAVQFMDALEVVMGRLHPDSISSATITALRPAPALAPVLVAPGDLATGASQPAHPVQRR